MQIRGALNKRLSVNMLNEKRNNKKILKSKTFSSEI